MTIKTLLKKEDLNSTLKAKVAIIVPYRDQIEENRKLQLKIFIKHFNIFLKNYDTWKIFVIKQSFDNNKFNRGKLLNVGFKIAEKYDFNTFIFHDVDLLPVSSMFKLYTTYPEKPLHIGSLWKIKYDYPTFVGGAISVNIQDYKKINGFPNIFWGWGGEDDALYFRLMVNNIDIWEPQIKDWGKIHEMQHGWNPSEGNEKKKENRNFDKYNWKKNGLNNLEFNILKKKYLKSEKTVKITVDLGDLKSFTYKLDSSNLAVNKQDLKNLIINPRNEFIKDNYPKFKKTLKFIIKYFNQATYVLIKNNQLKIFTTFNFDKENYVNMKLINDYFIKINKMKNLNNIEFFINTQPFSLTYEDENDFLPIVSDILNLNTNDINLNKLIIHHQM
jgi:sulfur relay (sulfurtransferase) DsrF/TusC family protein